MARQQIAASIFNMNLPAKPSALIALAILAAILTTVPSAQAQTFQVIHSFTNGQDGAVPNGLTIDRSGSLYGTTSGPTDCYTRCGNVYKFSSHGLGWILSPLYAFRGGSDGNRPLATVTIAADGSLYGTTAAGGGGGGCDFGGLSGCGTVYHLRPPAEVCTAVNCPWTNTILHAFTGYPDLNSPSSEIVFDQAGNLYGSSGYGGPYPIGLGLGGVYELTLSQGSWSYSIAYAFPGTPNGWGPFGAVLLDQAGNIYGTTYGGGAYTYGTVYKMTHAGSGWNEAILYSFGDGQTDGIGPIIGLTSDSAGNLYGSTPDGGLNDNGEVFQLSPLNGGYTYSVLYYGFGPAHGQGGGPDSKLVMDRAGNLYGTQFGGGANGDGIIFKLTPGNDGWTFTDLHDFDSSDGYHPAGNLVLDSNGNLYGTTYGGGAYGDGVIWELTP